MSVTYTATLSVREETVLFVSSLLHGERQRRGTRADTRALGCFKQAVLVIRWFLDGTRVTQLATDNAIGRSTGYDYLHLRHEAPNDRVGVRDPPPLGRRSGLMKLGAA